MLGVLAEKLSYVQPQQLVKSKRSAMAGAIDAGTLAFGSWINFGCTKHLFKSESGPQELA